MRVKLLCIGIILIVILTFTCYAHISQDTGQTIPGPEVFFGFKPGSDYMLFDYEALIKYLQELDEASPKLKMVQIGASPMGRPMYIAFISAEDNITRLSQLKQINKRLALDPAIADNERENMFEQGKVFVLATLSMHSGEVGPSQSAPLIAYDLITTKDQQTLEILKKVVYMLVPCHNPDGMDMVVNHYKKYKGTKYDGSDMPGVYHKYIGHDNNRDFITLSQEDTKAIAGIYNSDWFPQVMVEKHQMGSRGPRYFVPPVHDPIAENIDGELWNWTGIFGSNLIKDMTAEGLSGISQHYLFDDYWPGSTETCIWKNVIGFLTECASAKYATPIFVEPNELSVGGKGLSEYKKSINMPSVWPGGWWRLSDIVQYEITSTLSILKTAYLHHKDILQYRNDLCRREVSKGQSEPPYYFIMRRQQHDSSELAGLLNLLREHGVYVFRLDAAVKIGDMSFAAGDFVVPLAQPYRAFVKEVLEKQNYPLRHYTPGGKIIRPYDITSWSLPLHRGVDIYQIDIRSGELESAIQKIEQDIKFRDQDPDAYMAAIFSVQNNESFKVAFKALNQGLTVLRLKQKISIANSDLSEGSFIINRSKKLEQILVDITVAPKYVQEELQGQTEKLTLPRIALVETYFHDMDAGWTRYLFDSYGIPFKVIRPGDFEKTNFSRDYDIVIFPDVAESILMEGKWKSRDEYYISSYPPEFTKGIGKDGMKPLLDFLDKGGRIISWGRSTNLFDGTLEIAIAKDKTEEFQLPFRDISENLQKEGLYCPGSLVKIRLTKAHPLTLGTPNEIGVFYRGRPVFTTSIPDFDMDRRVIAVFPEKDILLSGYCENEEKIGDKSAMVWLKKGKGQLILFAFNPQFRASTNVSYKLLFNSLLLPKLRK